MVSVFPSTFTRTIVYCLIFFIKEIKSDEALRQDFQNEEPRIDDGSLIAIKQVPRNTITAGRGFPNMGISKEAMRERLDSIVLLLTRLSDRMVAIETKQNHQTERIDNINYRLTKIDVQGEERKSQLAQVSTTVQHQIQSTKDQTNAIKSLLENIHVEIDNFKSNRREMTNILNRHKMSEPKENANRKSAKLSTILTTVFGIKAEINVLKSAFETISTNLTLLSNSTRSMRTLSDNLALREDLVTSMADMRSEIQKSTMQHIYRNEPKSSPNLVNSNSATDCWELLHKKGKTKSGVYRIQPPLSYLPFFVYCDMETDGGGWTVFQRREDGSIDFTMDWNDYKQGFGNLAGEFWLGNEKIYRLTNHQVNELRIVLGDFAQKIAVASYSAFAIGPESEAYALKLLGQYKGDAGDSLSYHVGQKWSTHDVDNDAWPDQNCARDHSGAWWYRACETSNLNGQYLHGPVQGENEYKGIYWYDFHGPQYSLWQSTMMIRRGGAVSKLEVAPPELK